MAVRGLGAMLSFSVGFLFPFIFNHCHPGCCSSHFWCLEAAVNYWAKLVMASQAECNWPDGGRWCTQCIPGPQPANHLNECLTPPEAIQADSSKWGFQFPLLRDQRGDVFFAASNDGHRICPSGVQFGDHGRQKKNRKGTRRGK